MLVFLLRNPMIVQSPSGEMRARLVSPNTKIQIEGVEFLASIMLLDSLTIDVILGMELLAKHQGQIRCVDKTTTLVNAQGIEVTFITRTPFCQACIVHSLKSILLEDVPVVREYSDIFLEDLPSVLPDRDLEFMIKLAPSTAPISKRLYRMPANELEELKK